jgi:hypothetical protein
MHGCRSDPAAVLWEFLFENLTLNDVFRRIRRLSVADLCGYPLSMIATAHLGSGI